MLILKGRVCFFVIVIFISCAVAKTVDVEPPVHEEVKVVSESGSIIPDKADNSTLSLQENWAKTAAEKLHKIKKIDKEHLVSEDSKRNKTSLKANNTSEKKVDLKRGSSNSKLIIDDFDVQEISLQLASEIKNDKIQDMTNTTTESSSSNGPTMEFTVTSPPLSLSKESDNNTATNSIPVALSPESNATVASLLIDDDNKDKGSEYNFKDKLRPSFHPYMEEILSNETTDENMPVIIKQTDYVPSQNALMLPHPYGNLPSFSEKELGRLRLNHWRVKQILKGLVDTEAEKMGLPGSRKAILQNKYPYPIIGQKRTAFGEPTYLDDSAGDSLSSLLTSADQDMTPGQLSSLPSSNLRTFFSWFTNPSKINPNSDPDRVKLIQAQQAILPLALDYRGDFLFW